jgi:hypothetical protein
MKKLGLFLVAALLLLIPVLPGCTTASSTTPTTVAAVMPVVNNFTAVPTILTAGDSATLQWNVTGATTVTISPGVGNVALSGSQAVSPAGTTTYTLTAQSGAGTQTANVIITVNPAPTPVTPVIINTFSVDQSMITAGQSVTLKWNVTGATAVTIDPDIGSVALSGSKTVSPAGTTTYTLTAQGSAGPQTADVIVTVNPAPAQVVVNAFSVDPSMIDVGQSATLQWNVTGATIVKIDPDIGDVASSGSETVSPTETTTYVLTANNDANSTTATAVLTVNPVSPEPIVEYFEVTPGTINLGYSATLEWNVTGADSVFIYQNIGSVPEQGSRSISPAETTTYTLIATNSGGTVTASTTLDVNPENYPYYPENLPVVNFFDVNPPIISLGSSATLSWEVTNAYQVSIDNGIGNVAATGSLLVAPGVSTSYIITASNSYGTIRQTAVLVVNPAAFQPAINVFSSTPSSIQTGQSSTLQWEVSGATSVSINQGIGSVSASGSRTVSPTKTTAYTLTASNGYSLVTSSVTVVVSPSPAYPVIQSFFASPPSILAGQTSTLQWVVSGAISVSINQGIGAVTASGTRVVSPSVTTSYTITASNSAGSVTALVTIGVSRPSALPYIISFSGRPATTLPGQPVTLQWQVSGATSVVIDQGIGPVSASGSIVVTPQTTTVYTLTARNSAGVVMHTVQITIYVPPRAVAG